LHELWAAYFSGGGKHKCSFYDVICVENLLSAWHEFKKGKLSKDDVAQFELDLESNLFNLYQELISLKWQPDPYEMFFVNDPKLRKIHKATVRDRVLYQAVYQVLYHLFDPSFIHDSYSSRNRKGTYVGIYSFENHIRKVGKNFTKPVFAVKCDIRKFFDSIDHTILLSLIDRKIKDTNLILLIRKIISSFSVSQNKGLPLGNVTSQLFANIYMNHLDQYIKREIKVKYYVRYCDDFVITSNSMEYLQQCVQKIGIFCKKELLLNLHPKKIIYRKINQGMDFLGYVILPHRRVLRTKTKKRIIKKISILKIQFNAGKIDKKYFDQVNNAYAGVLSHCKSEKIKEQIKLSCK
jgi:retron-type reverse transcriptase